MWPLMKKSQAIIIKHHYIYGQDMEDKRWKETVIVSILFIQSESIHGGKENMFKKITDYVICIGIEGSVRLAESRDWFVTSTW